MKEKKKKKQVRVWNGEEGEKDMNNCWMILKREKIKPGFRCKKSGKGQESNISIILLFFSFKIKKHNTYFNSQGSSQLRLNLTLIIKMVLNENKLKIHFLEQT